MYESFKIFNLKLLFIVLILLACSSSDSPLVSGNPTDPDNNGDDSIYKILPLGDSRVEGATINSVSYRYDLWRNLVNGQWEFDYIGTQVDNTSYPELLGQTFDPDHQGIGGFRTQDVLDNIEVVLQESGIPDVVLLGIGGNDLVHNISVASAIYNINQTIDLLQNRNSDITIFIERIAPGRSNVMTPETVVILAEFNSSISSLAADQTTDNSKVIAVDMSVDWSDAYMADNLHYNELGAKEVADRYFEAIENNLQ